MHILYALRLDIGCFENYFQQEKQEPWLASNPGLALTGFRTTGPRGARARLPALK